MTEIDRTKLDLIRSSLRICPNFPKAGINFVDIFGLFLDATAHRTLIDVLVEHLKSKNVQIDAIVGLEARGFVFGPQLALELKIPFVPIRKKGKLPGNVTKTSYTLEYGEDSIEIQTDRLEKGKKVVLVDDLLATGGTLAAARSLCEKVGLEVQEMLVIVELTDLGGRAKLNFGDRCSSILCLSDVELESIRKKEKDASRCFLMVDWRPFLFGGLASSVAELATFPIDLTKTRLQIQGQIFDNSIQKFEYAEKKYKNMFQAVYRIGKEEGIRKLYSGVSAALLRQATYGTIKIGIYQKVKRIFAEDIRQEKLHINVCNGMFSGALANAIANPTDLLKIRMQANHPSVRGKGLFPALISISRKEGLGGLWAGVLPTAQRAAIVSGVELAIYDWTKKQFICRMDFSDTIGTHFLSSFIAGFAGALASTPIDVVRTRLMNQENLRPNLHSNVVSAPYQGIVDCFVKTTKNEGFFALYKGFFPSWLRLGPWNIVFFIAYEQLKKFDV